MSAVGSVVGGQRRLGVETAKGFGMFRLSLLSREIRSAWFGNHVYLWPKTLVGFSWNSIWKSNLHSVVERAWFSWKLAKRVMLTISYPTFYIPDLFGWNSASICDLNLRRIFMKFGLKKVNYTALSSESDLLENWLNESCLQFLTLRFIFLTYLGEIRR